ncbi:MAG: hypothetical protein HY552_05080 [Elusimicrobia bacterium]|nr:hypothetical protein [Elusimicrobiota bacterium]
MMRFPRLALAFALLASTTLPLHAQEEGEAADAVPASDAPAPPAEDAAADETAPPAAPAPASPAPPAPAARPAPPAVKAAAKVPRKARRRPAAKRARAKARVRESRYKSRVLSEGAEHHYRFDARGNPLRRSKPGAKPRKGGAPVAPAPDSRACAADGSCPDGAAKSSDADAL